jgi:hypothetical protein
MKTNEELNAVSIPLSSTDLQNINGGLGLLALGILKEWCKYLLEHDEQLVEGLKDGWNELYGTITK